MRKIQALAPNKLPEAGQQVDGTTVCKPTLEGLVIAHQRFIWFDVVVCGLASHGSLFDLGVDAISRVGYFLVELDRYAQRLIVGARHPSLGPGGVHTSIVKGDLMGTARWREVCSSDGVFNG
jgi:acetylornithine deacetylase/succinyl-diaminopimelate desuccinylase-like protein